METRTNSRTASQLDYLLDKGSFVSHGDDTFSVDFKKWPGPEGVVSSCPGH